MSSYICGCCLAYIVTEKAQDPQRDDGYGTCDSCFESMVKKDMLSGAWPTIKNEKDLEEYRRKYA